MSPVILILIATLLWNKISIIKSQISLVGSISTLRDAQELVNAYREHDYVQVMIKLINIKLKIDPPQQGSREEKELLLAKRLLVKIHPSYIKWTAKKKLKKEEASDTKTKISLKHAKLIEAAINILNFVMKKVNASTDYVINFLNEIKSELLEILEKAEEKIKSSVNKDEGVGLEDDVSNDEAEPELSNNDNDEKTTAKPIANTTDKIHKNKIHYNNKTDGVKPSTMSTVPKPLIENNLKNQTINKVIHTTPLSTPKNNSNQNLNKPTTNNLYNKQPKCVKQEPIIYRGYQNINPYPYYNGPNHQIIVVGPQGPYKSYPKPIIVSPQYINQPVRNRAIINENKMMATTKHANNQKGTPLSTNKQK